MACPARNSWTRLIQLQFAHQVRRAHVAEKVLEYTNLAFVDRVAVRSVLLNSSGTLINSYEDLLGFEVHTPSVLDFEQEILLPHARVDELADAIIVWATERTGKSSP